MEIRHQRFVRSALTPVEGLELEHVDALALQLSERLRTSAAEIDLVHIHRAQSSAEGPPRTTRQSPTCAPR